MKQKTLTKKNNVLLFIYLLENDFKIKKKCTKLLKHPIAIVLVTIFSFMTQFKKYITFNTKSGGVFGLTVGLATLKRKMYLVSVSPFS